MKLFYLLLLLCSSASIQAEDIYIAQTATGIGDTISTPTNYTFFNTSGNWGAGAGKISPGDTVRLVGTITNGLTVQGNGSSGSVVTILFEADAKLSSTAFSANSALKIDTKQYILVDGGSNGKIENTQNGTALAHQNYSYGMILTGSTNVEVMNLTITNIYVRTSLTDSAASSDNVNCIYALNPRDGISIHNCYFSGANYLINFQNSSAGTGSINIYSNYFADCNIAINWGIGTATVSGSSVYANSFRDFAGWDDNTANNYHHNGLHLYITSSGTATVDFYRNRFSGSAGQYTTSQLCYYECDNVSSTIISSKIYNNLSEAPTDSYGNFGAIAIGGAGTSTANLVGNNTIIGNGASGFYGVLVSQGSGNTSIFKNNVFKSCGAGVYFYSVAASVVWDYNLYSGNTHLGSRGGSTYDTIASWRTALGGVNEANGIDNATSGIGSSGTQSEGSVTIDSGTDLSGNYSVDYLGVTRPSGAAWDIGTFEYVAPSAFWNGFSFGLGIRTSGRVTISQ